MHASIALFVMMVGGPVFPEAEITTVPLKDDLLSQTSILQWEHDQAVNGRHLPPSPIPTFDNRKQSSDDFQPPGRKQLPVRSDRPACPCPAAKTARDAPASNRRWA